MVNGWKNCVKRPFYFFLFLLLLAFPTITTLNLMTISPLYRSFSFLHLDERCTVEKHCSPIPQTILTLTNSAIG